MQRGQIIAGRFEIEVLAGKGGMADVYRASDRSTGAAVALKILHSNAPDDLARLAREAQALARLTHHAIVRYVGHGVDDSAAYVVMEWIEGEPLSRRLRSGPLSLIETLQLGRALASALDDAHEHAIVHRDLKPSNVLLRGGDLADPVLLDFGIARTGLAVGLTQLGTIVGTPRYMAPEQARGGRLIDARADVFALGALMFRCFIGRPPFDGEDAIAILAHLFFDEVPDICALVSNVPRSVGDLFSTMLAKEASARYADGGAVVRAIDALDVTQVPTILPAASGLTLRERRLLSLMVLTGSVDASVAKRVVDGFGGRTERLADGNVVVLVGGRADASELARVSARCALELRRVLPAAPIVLATGRSNDTDDNDETVSDAGEATGSNNSSYSGVFERAAALLRVDIDGTMVRRRDLPIVIDDTTAALLGADFDIVGVVGSSVRELRGVAAAHTRYTLFGKPTPFVGRARELASLLATWDDVCEQDVARAMLVVGDAGLGKSRLLHEMLEALAEHGAPVFRLRARADAITAGSPFAALAPAIRRELGIDDDEDASQRWNKLAQHINSVVVEGGKDVADFVAEIADAREPTPSADVAIARKDPRLMADRLRRAWRAWMKAEAARGPVLVIIEDLQWADLPTVKLLDEMFVDLPEAPIFVLAFARPDVDAVFPNIWSRVVTRMPLSPLSKKAAVAYASALVNDHAKVERIVTLALGNALHLEQLVRSTIEGKTEVPESLLAVLSAHVEQLPDTERRVLRAASIFGSTFGSEGVSVLLSGTLEPGAGIRAEVGTLLESLGRRELVAARDRTLEFRNALVRDVTYQMLTEDDRRHGHRLAADWLERSSRSDPFVIAEHRERGGQLSEAVSLYERSATHAMDASDLGVAISRINRARACGAEGETLARLCALAAEAQRWRAETKECAREAAQAIGLAAPGSATRFVALGLAAYAASYFGDTRALHEATDALLAVDPSADVVTDWARALRHASTGLALTGYAARHDALIAALERVSVLHGADPTLSEALLTCKGHRAFGCGDFTTLVEVNRISAGQRKAMGDERGLGLAFANAGFGLMWLGRLDDARVAYETARALSVALKLVTIELSAIQNLAFISLCANDTGDAIRGSRDVLTRASSEAPRLMSLARLCLARALVAQGELDAAELDARAGLAAARNEVVGMYSRTVLAHVLLLKQQVEAAMHVSSDAMAVFETLRAFAVGDLYTLIVHAEVLEAAGARNKADDTIRRAYAMFESRRAYLTDDAARSTLDAQSPDAQHLMAAHRRLLGRTPD